MFQTPGNATVTALNWIKPQQKFHFGKYLNNQPGKRQHCRIKFKAVVQYLHYFLVVPEYK